MTEPLYGAGAAAGYDRFFGTVSSRFIPALLRIAALAPGERVLDVATGTGIAAEAAATAVGPRGQVLAVDISPPMLEEARRRLGALPQATVAREDGQALTFPDGSFDAVLCHLGLMFFPDPARGLAEFRRVLRPGGRAAVSVNAPRRGYVTPVAAAIAARSGKAKASEGMTTAIGEPRRLEALLAGAGFAEVEVATETYRFELPSFEAYFAGVERGDGGVGADFVALPEADRSAVREEVRSRLGGGGPFALEVEIHFGRGRR